MDFLFLCCVDVCIFFGLEFCFLMFLNFGRSFDFFEFGDFCVSDNIDALCGSKAHTTFGRYRRWA